MFLVLTGLEINLLKEQKYELLGEWIKEYKPKNFWIKNKVKTFKNPWNNKEKLLSDHTYLEIVHKNLLNDLSSYLNKINQVNHSKRYWQTLLDPWLLSYIAVIYDRWQTLDTILKKNYKVLSPENGFKHKRPKITDYAIDKLFQEDEWNHNLFLEIINYKFKEKVSIIKDKRFKSKRQRISNFKKRFYYKNTLKSSINFFSLILCKLNLSPDIFIGTSYLNKKDKFLFKINLKQNPFFDLHFHYSDKNFSFDENYKNYKEINSSEQLNEFEKFLYNRIKKDLPLELIDDYKFWSRNSFSSYIPKVILSDNLHIQNAKFKHWLANCLEKGSKILLTAHGGSICHDNYMNFPEEISDRYFSWKKPSHSKHKQLPPLNYTDLKINKISKGEFISLIGVDFPIYIFRCQRAGSGSEVYKHHKQFLVLYKYLNKDLKKIFKFKPYVNSFRGLLKEYEKEFGKKSIEKNIDYKEFIKNSKLVIASYPQTTFSDCIMRNKPTILLYPSNVWIITDDMLEVRDKLIGAKVLFNDAQKAASHINRISEDISKWWDSQKVREAIEFFHENALLKNKNWEICWINAIKEEINK